MTQRKSIFLYSGIFLATLWLLSALPLPFLFFEFGDIKLCGDVSLAAYLAGFYGSLYIYPVSVGIFSFTALYLPLTTAVACIHTSGKLKIVVAVLLASLLVLTAFELVGSPKAVFELSPNTLKQ